MAAGEKLVIYAEPGRLWRRIEETREERGRVVIIRRKILLNTGIEATAINAEIGDEAKISPETIRFGAN
jgi:hypothetical protein